MHESEKWKWSRSVVSNSSRPGLPQTCSSFLSKQAIRWALLKCSLPALQSGKPCKHSKLFELIAFVSSVFRVTVTRYWLQLSWKQTLRSPSTAVEFFFFFFPFSIKELLKGTPKSHTEKCFPLPLSLRRTGPRAAERTQATPPPPQLRLRVTAQA